MSQQTTIKSLFAVGQIRLAELSVYNWGSFHGLHSARIDAGGTLVTGDNGSGKTTFIDGLMALLLPAGRATFNVAAAQGDRSDRTLLSYMRGSFGSDHDGGRTRVKSKREHAVITGLRALYRADDGSLVTLAALFWTLQSSNSLSDVKRLYLIAPCDISLKDLLAAFPAGDVRGLKRWLKEHPQITSCDDNFSEYQALYRKLLYMENKNAPALLSRALGLKKIDDLTALIRELVLEPSSIKEDARKVVDEFADLVAIHEQLLDARRQKEHLSKLPELEQTLQRSQQSILDLSEERDGLSIYLGELCSAFWQQRIQQLQAKQANLALQIKQIMEEEQEAQQWVESRHVDYINAGGGQMERLHQDLERTQQELQRVIVQASRYQALLRDLELDETLNEALFLQHQQQAQTRLQSMATDNHAAQDCFAAISAELSNQQEHLRETERAITEIKTRPNSNIDLRFQQLRDEMIDALQLEHEQCMFIGELLEVDESHRAWQGAIERALGGLRTTLLVPHSHFSMVTRWLNARHTGLHVRVQVVQANPVANASFKERGFLCKLHWRDHPYRSWLQAHLARFDLLCVASTEELDRTPFSMTQQGLMHMDKGRFEKKDQHPIGDRRYWQLGFSNQMRLALLQSDEKQLREQLQQTMQAVTQARHALDALMQQQAAWQKLVEFDWEQIHVQRWQQQKERIQQDLQQLQQTELNLEQTRLRWESAKQALKQVQQQKEEQVQLRGELNRLMLEAESRLQTAQKEAQQGLEEAIRQRLHQRLGELSETELEKPEERERNQRNQLEQQLESARTERNRAETRTISILSSFRQKWEVIAVDWGAELSALPDYQQHLQQLEEEGLPQLVEQFKERLNKHATQSLARIRQRLDSERDDILERIDVINEVLQRTEFRPGSYLKLGAKIERYPHVHAFNQQISLVLSQVTSEDHEARFQQLQQVISILSKASNPTTSGTLESLRLLDPRYQMSFYAEELDAQNGAVRDVLESSSGKSGGEKESFAGTIVAASLAYVLTPDGFDRPIYSTVFLDEAFSNTAEAVSRRVLKVFRELHIHVNLITPYKNLNLARESARSLLIAERQAETHESRLCEITWQELDQRMQQARQQQTKQQASALGVELR